MKELAKQTNTTHGLFVILCVLPIDKCIAATQCEMQLIDEIEEEHINHWFWQCQNQYIISVIWDALPLMWRHYNNDVTWAAGRLKLPTDNLADCPTVFQLTTKETPSSILLSLCERIHGSLVESPHKGTTLRKAFSCHRADQQVLPTETVSLSNGVPHSYSNEQHFGNWDF